jgi:pimeloyl-ACP methyl ester carboxylesterase
MPIVLVGHSWGGYNVLCAASKVKVQGVVAFSAFNSPTKAIIDAAESMSGKKMLIVRIVKPYLWLYNFFKFGSMGNLKAGKAISKSDVPALLIHGEKDAVVPLSNSAAKKAQGKQVMLEKDKRHNPYNTVAAEDALVQLRNALADDLSKEWFGGFDYVAATEEDQKVMLATKNFIESL